MEGFLHILKLNPEYESIVDVKEILHNFKTKSLNVTEVTKNNITSVYFSNEHVEYPYKDTSNGLFTPVGVFTRNRESIKDYLSSNTPANKQNFIKNLEGQFAIGLVCQQYSRQFI